MPAESQAQRGFIFANFGPEWAKKHHFDNPGKLPAYVAKHAKGTANVGLMLFRQKAHHNESNILRNTPRFSGFLPQGYAGHESRRRAGVRG